MTAEACAATCTDLGDCRRHGCREWQLSPGEIVAASPGRQPLTVARRHEDEATVPGPRPFDRGCLMRRLALLDRWAS